MLQKNNKKELIAKFAKSSNDTGSSEVQIGLLTARIHEISQHLKLFPKDKHSQRGLLLLVGKRRSLAKYLQNNDKEAYKRVMQLIDAKKEETAS